MTPDTAQPDFDHEETPGLDAGLIETERTVVGVCLCDPQRGLGIRDLDATHFGVPSHGVIWGAMQNITAAGEIADAVTVADHFTRLGRKGLAQQVLEIASTCYVAGDPTYHAQRIREAWQTRQGMRIANELRVSCARRDADGIDAAIASLMALHATRKPCEFTGKQAAQMAWEAVAANYDSQGMVGITTGLGLLDRHLGGLHAGDLIVIGARPSMGKTALMLGMARAAARAGHPVGIVSGEQSAQQVGARLIALQARVAATKFRSGRFADEEWPRLTDGIKALAELPVWILDRSAPSLSDVVRTARKWVHLHGVRALYVDYLQRIDPPPGIERRHEAVGAVAKGLKTLANDLEIPVVALAQVRRDVDSRSNQRPRMGDLSDSSEIEKEADQVLMLYRDEVVNPDTQDHGVAEILVEKNRHGPAACVCRVSWHGETMAFRNLARDSELDLDGEEAA